VSSPTNNQATPSEPSVCPDCGGRLSRLPTVGGDGYLWICDRCDYQQLVQREPDPAIEDLEDPAPPSDEDSQRFRRLLAGSDEPVRPDGWPQYLLDDLPPDARQALERRPLSADAAPPTEDIPGHVKRTLMDYGFAVDEDARGLRLRFPGGLRRPGTGDLSATDVVRLASQLGGAPPPEERRTCPACQAVLPRTAERCSWCDTDLPPLDPGN